MAPSPPGRPTPPPLGGPPRTSRPPSWTGPSTREGARGAIQGDQSRWERSPRIQVLGQAVGGSLR
eukprot:3262069-Pyramimonas_sp.AAC.1